MKEVKESNLSITPGQGEDEPQKAAEPIMKIDEDEEPAELDEHEENTPIVGDSVVSLASFQTLGSEN